MGCHHVFLHSHSHSYFLNGENSILMLQNWATNNWTEPWNLWFSVWSYIYWKYWHKYCASLIHNLFICYMFSTFYRFATDWSYAARSKDKAVRWWSGLSPGLVSKPAVTVPACQPGETWSGGRGSHRAHREPGSHHVWQVNTVKLHEAMQG